MTLNDFIPTEVDVYGNTVWATCSMWTDEYKNQTKKCDTGWVYDLYEFDEMGTITIEVMQI